MFHVWTVCVTEWASLLWLAPQFFSLLYPCVTCLHDLDFIYPPPFRNKDYGVKLEPNSYASLTNKKNYLLLVGKFTPLFIEEEV